MALTDITYNDEETKNFILEIPSASYSGSLSNILTRESNVNELPKGMRVSGIGGKHIIGSN